MDTKRKADLAEYGLVKELIRRNWNVLKPVGDRLPYDLVIERNGKFLKIQVKSAWFNESKKMYIVDVRRTRTNRRKMKRVRYSDGDFDFAALYIEEADAFYIMPVKVFNEYASSISLVESEKRQRKPKSYRYRERWDLLVNMV